MSPSLFNSFALFNPNSNISISGDEFVETAQHEKIKQQHYDKQQLRANNKIWIFDDGDKGIRHPRQKRL
jgi:hypothetical protein